MPIPVTREEALALRAACQSHSVQDVVAHTGRSLSTVLRAVNNPLPPALPRRDGRPVSPGNEPRAIARRVYGIYGGVSIDVITRGGVDVVRQRLNRGARAQGAPILKKTTFRKKWPDVAAILGAIPNVSFVNPGPVDLANVASRIKGARVGAHVRVGSNALTSRAIVLALVGLSARRDAVIEVLYDRGWVWSCPDALEGLAQLYDAGIETRHLRSAKVHMNAVCIDGDYCFSGSATHGEAGFGHNCELNTHVEGIRCEDACKIFDGFYHGEQATLTTASAAAKMTTAAAALRARAAAGATVTSAS